jgi:hypothetical protein
VRRSARAGLAVCVLAAGAGAFLAAADALGSGAGRSANAGAPAAVVAIERDGLRYQYNTLTGRECLYDRDSPPEERRDLAADRPLDLRRLRRLLEAELGVPDLGVLHEPHRETADALRGLGYL